MPSSNPSTSTSIPSGPALSSESSQILKAFEGANDLISDARAPTQAPAVDCADDAVHSKGEDKGKKREAFKRMFRSNRDAGSDSATLISTAAGPRGPVDTFFTVTNTEDAARCKGYSMNRIEGRHSCSEPYSALFRAYERGCNSSPRLPNDFSGLTRLAWSGKINKDITVRTLFETDGGPSESSITASSDEAGSEVYVSPNGLISALLSGGLSGNKLDELHKQYSDLEKEGHERRTPGFSHVCKSAHATSLAFLTALLDTSSTGDEKWSELVIKEPALYSSKQWGPETSTVGWADVEVCVRMPTVLTNGTAIEQEECVMGGPIESGVASVPKQKS